jgi:hypothetical protein
MNGEDAVSKTRPWINPKLHISQVTKVCLAPTSRLLCIGSTIYSRNFPTDIPRPWNNDDNETAEALSSSFRDDQRKKPINLE